MAHQIALEKGFTEELSGVLAGNEHGVADLLDQLPDEEAMDLGRKAARQALAPLVWRAIAGNVLDTSQVAELLAVTRQAIAKRVHRHSLLAIPGRGITYFPTWQFDLDSREVRPFVRDVLDNFAGSLGRVDPLLVVSWSSSPQYDELEGLTPQEWITKGGSDETLKLSARRAAAALVP